MIDLGTACESDRRGQSVPLRLRRRDRHRSGDRQGPVDYIEKTSFTLFPRHARSAVEGLHVRRPSAFRFTGVGPVAASAVGEARRSSGSEFPESDTDPRARPSALLIAFGLGLLGSAEAQRKPRARGAGRRRARASGRSRTTTPALAKKTTAPAISSGTAIRCSAADVLGRLAGTSGRPRARARTRS